MYLIFQAEQYSRFLLIIKFDIESQIGCYDNKLFNQLGRLQGNIFEFTVFTCYKFVKQ